MAEGAARLLVACLCAQWCGACREYRPVFDAVAARFADAADFAWIDIEDESDALGDPDIENFPTLLIVNDGAALFYGTVTPQAQTAERLVRGALAGELAPLGREAAELAERAVRIGRQR
ncbi:MAG: thioredoxin family protein [Pseudomonadota bacterium]|nr:thioredoxin family protein [Pseudomonadota bacterium]